jgi:biotin transport system substrate-specific component
LQTFAVLLSAAALGTWRSVAAMAVYVLAGALGVPWFAGHSSGVSAPSFGYLIGFVVAAMVVGRMAEKGSSRTPAGTALAMLVGSIVIYAIGASWLKVAIGCDWPTAISLGVTPFIVGDLLKLVFATALLPLSWSGLRRAGLLDEPDDRS